MNNRKKGMFLIFGPIVLLIFSLILFLLSVFLFDLDYSLILIIRKIISILAIISIIAMVPCWIIGFILSNKKDDNFSENEKNENLNRNYSKEEISISIKKFNKKRNIMIFQFIFLLFVLFILKFLSKNPEVRLFGLSNKYLYIFSFFVIVIYPFFSYFNWRCPNCKNYFGSTLNPKKCDKCGISLQNN